VRQRPCQLPAFAARAGSVPVTRPQTCWGSARAASWRPTCQRWRSWCACVRRRAQRLLSHRILVAVAQTRATQMTSRQAASSPFTGCMCTAWSMLWRAVWPHVLPDRRRCVLCADGPHRSAADDGRRRLDHGMSAGAALQARRRGESGRRGARDGDGRGSYRAAGARRPRPCRPGGVGGAEPRCEAVPSEAPAFLEGQARTCVFSVAACCWLCAVLPGGRCAEHPRHINLISVALMAAHEGFPCETLQTGHSDRNLTQRTCQ